MMTTPIKILAVSISIAAFQWSDQVQAGSLMESVNEALATNPEIAVRTNEALARADEIRQAKAGYLPRIDLSAGIGYEKSRNATTLNDTDTDKTYAERTRREASVTLRQMLFDGFETSSSVDQQSARTESAEEDICAIVDTVALRAAKSYIDVLRGRKQVENAQLNLKKHEEIVGSIRNREQSGLGSEADTSQAEARLVLARANLISLESTLRDAEAAYRSNVGNLPESMDNAEAPVTLPDNESAAHKLAASHHPVLKLAMADIHAAEALYEKAKSLFYPTVQAELGATWGKDQNGSKGTVHDTTAMLRVNYNLYNGGADKARKSQTANLLNEAIEIKNRAHRQVNEEVSLAWIAVTYGQDRLRSLANHVDYTMRSRDLYAKQFNAGTRTLLDLLDSQNEYFNALNSYTNANNDLLYNQYRLLQSTGTLVSSINVSVPDQAVHCKETL